ncbi:MAG: leucyl aminopeptidase [Bacteroidetes bacterium]|nr:leucyl aminopeptidase [Bacteroidota bacterium]
MIHFSLPLASKPDVLIFLFDDLSQLASLNLTNDELGFVENVLAREQVLIPINRFDVMRFLYCIKPKASEQDTLEMLRKAGADLCGTLKNMKAATVGLENFSKTTDAAVCFSQGLALASYQFIKYFNDAAKKANPLATISFTESSIQAAQVAQLNVWTAAAFKMRDLINEPLNALSAVGLSEKITALGKEAGFAVTVLHKAEIEAEKMGGILSVNRGSIDPPSFSIMEYKAEQPINERPIVLVGKGIVYDTGGLSLKPTPNSMDRMKSDMSGAALVSTAMWAIASLKLPLHVIALAPSTDNRPGENAYVPGDIITMYDGTSVEVLNTDAEGRLVLADALHWAKRYNPALVMDFATLTGAASAAIGEHGIVCMGTADESIKTQLSASGYRQYERLVEFPLWDEYGKQLKSEFAELKNVGGPTGGAITAGKFLQHFTDYPWMHFDIAGVSFNTAGKGYLPAGGTAVGLRMVLDFLSNYNG